MHEYFRRVHRLQRLSNVRFIKLHRSELGLKQRPGEDLTFQRPVKLLCDDKFFRHKIVLNILRVDYAETVENFVKSKIIMI